MKLEINLLLHEDKIKKRVDQGKVRVYDPIRKKYLLATPEEWVRQLFISFLVSEKNIPLNKIAVEKQLVINSMQRRFDIVVYGENFVPLTIIECKSPKVSISDDTFRQASAYNLELRAPFLIVTNGMTTYHCAIDFENRSFRFLNSI
jgi:type I site-specific restriction-modification system R (restriction) subunit